jgi:hypothetical protein
MRNPPPYRLNVVATRGDLKALPKAYRDPGSNTAIRPSAIDKKVQMRDPTSGIKNVIAVVGALALLWLITLVELPELCNFRSATSDPNSPYD